MFKTTDLISKLETLKDKSKVSILVTLNVRRLYTNILNHRKSMKKTLNNQTTKPIATRKITKFLHLILTLSNFICNGINYFQVVEWAQYGHNLHMPPFSWVQLQKCTLELFQLFTVNKTAIDNIYFLMEQNGIYTN